MMPDDNVDWLGQSLIMVYGLSEEKKYKLGAEKNSDWVRPFVYAKMDFGPVVTKRKKKRRVLYGFVRLPK